MIFGLVYPKYWNFSIEKLKPIVNGPKWNILNVVVNIGLNWTVYNFAWVAYAMMVKVNYNYKAANLKILIEPKQCPLP